MKDTTSKTEIDKSLLLCQWCKMRLANTFITRETEEDKRRTFGTCDICKKPTYCRRVFVGKKITFPNNPTGKNGQNRRTDRREDAT